MLMPLWNIYLMINKAFGWVREVLLFHTQFLDSFEYANTTLHFQILLTVNTLEALKILSV